MLARILIPLFILVLGFGAWKWLGQPVEEPQSQRREPQKLETSRLELKRTRFPVILETQGTVRAHHTTTLTAQVAGTVKTVGAGFEDGAFFEVGEVLLELDPADLLASLAGSESRLARAEAALAQEWASRQAAARILCVDTDICRTAGKRGYSWERMVFTRFQGVGVAVRGLVAVGGKFA